MNSNALVAADTHGPMIDNPLIMRYGGYDCFYHKNHLGSITAITDSNQTVVKARICANLGNLWIRKDMDSRFHGNDRQGAECPGKREEKKPLCVPAGSADSDEIGGFYDR